MWLYCTFFAGSIPPPPMILSPHISLTIPVCAAVYLLTVYLLLTLAQRSKRLLRQRD